MASCKTESCKASARRHRLPLLNRRLLPRMRLPPPIERRRRDRANAVKVGLSREAFMTDMAQELLDYAALEAAARNVGINVITTEEAEAAEKLAKLQITEDVF